MREGGTKTHGALGGWEEGGAIEAVALSWAAGEIGGWDSCGEKRGLLLLEGYLWEGGLEEDKQGEASYLGRMLLAAVPSSVRWLP